MYLRYTSSNRPTETRRVRWARRRIKRLLLLPVDGFASLGCTVADKRWNVFPHTHPTTLDAYRRPPSVGHSLPVDARVSRTRNFSLVLLTETI